MTLNENKRKKRDPYEPAPMTVFKDKNHKPQGADFKFTRQFFIDRTTKKYCYIYNLNLS
jgi:hypothetical protein